MAAPSIQTLREALRCGRSGCSCKGARANVHCPAHEDAGPSLSVTESKSGKVLVKCHAGCAQDAVINALKGRWLWPTIHSNGSGDGGVSIPLNTTATVQPLGCTLAQYAEAKRLPLDFLQGLGLQDMNYLDTPAIRTPYMGRDASEGPVQFRLALSKGDGADNRFR
ncbi:MAG: hypothetical protein QGI09_08200, partial [Dehalococcoidia bacterium]|nr:hypothetical protein [Dehalococcoidia bacterium]